MNPSYFSITPHDPLISRDGRPFGFGKRMKSLDWFYPSVTTGTFRTITAKNAGVDFEDNNQERLKNNLKRLKEISVSGPFPLYNNRLYFPSPADIAVDEPAGKGRTSYRISPAQYADGEGSDIPHSSLLPAMLPKEVTDEFKPAPIAPFWSSERMTEWLTDYNLSGCPQSPEKNSLNSGYLSYPEKDVRTHITIKTKSGTAEDSKLFQTTGLDFTLRENKAGVNMALKVEDNNSGLITYSDNKILHTLGGERRLTIWEKTEKPLGWDCPEIIEKSLKNSKNIRMVLATPAIFSGGWMPGWLKEKDGSLQGTPPCSPEITLKLVSACLNHWKPISGWDMENNRPKPVRRIIPAGSVYFFETIGENSEPGSRLWLKSVCDDEQDRKDGFGLALWGIWN